MIGKLILTHGGLARELLASAQVISGRVGSFEALSLDWNDTVDEAREQVAAALRRLDTGDGVLILTDMYGGTPCNVAMSFFEEGKVEILTGVNLPMVLKLACQSNDTGGLGLEEMARRLRAKVQQSLCLASDMVQASKCGAADVPALAEKKHD